MKPQIILIILNVLTIPLFAQDYVRVIESEVDIQLNPSSSSNVVAQAVKGNIFNLIEEKDDWYNVKMFSGEYRYIHKSMCEKIDYDLGVPESEELRKDVFLALLNVEDKAQREADKKYPNDFAKNIDYNRALNDKFKLDVLNDYGLQPPVYLKIISEGVKKNWD